MKYAVAATSRFVQCRNRGIQVLIARYLKAFVASFTGRTATADAMAECYPPERQDLYGFTISDIKR